MFVIQRQAREDSPNLNKRTRVDSYKRITHQQDCKGMRSSTETMEKEGRARDKTRQVKEARQTARETSPMITAVDLFCGAGGLTHGLEMAGLDVKLGVDVDPHCRFP